MKFDDYMAVEMCDPAFAATYRETEQQLQAARAIIIARSESHLTQAELAERTGIRQSEISRLENGTRNPSVRLLQRLADGMGMTLRISFTPKDDGDAAVGGIVHDNCEDAPERELAAA